MEKLAAFFLIFLLQDVRFGEGHGRLVEPPSRASMWRYGFDSPVNYADNQLFCGGFTTQWEKNKGKCGVCGDPYDGKREHEAGGKYARGIIVRRYQPGGIMDVVVEITAPHGGWFEFRLCPVDDPRKAATWDCLNRHVLEMADGTGTRFKMTENKPGFHEIPLKLPPNIMCAQCVLQWKYNAGNSWGVEPGGKGCVGCGPQEQFYACSDIAIGNQTLPDDVTVAYWKDVYPDETTVGTIEHITSYDTDFNIDKYKSHKNKQSVEVDILGEYSEEFIRAKLLQLVDYFFQGEKHNSAERMSQTRMSFFCLLLLLAMR